MFAAVLAVHVVIAVALVILVLLNQGKGADMGAAFGSGASSTVFGSRGAATFMTKLIATLGTFFFVTSLSLAVMASRGLGMGAETSVIGDEPDVQELPTADLPDIPESPDDPDAPDDPVRELGDEMPEAPATPGEEEAPEAPAAPGEEGAPEAPAAPADEHAPEAPAEPAEEEAPEEPAP
ncbi:preprotein translocase subunit SecG [Halorhodospira abdelmalekii]|uniref:preprotein translocase subunit SecG n=1 Tax=Halorhodospira abdelmalekii TaxID=421629 RepID=UPI001904B817|nr:preprotein translocase subunit SecG [Halorhodospira abdelmalekii]MBK1734255.1 preprotein translocase subunit SecG [Halorhodospira abdelmalekii]